MSGVGYLVCTQDVRDAKPLKTILAVLGTLELTDHLGSHPVFVPLKFEVWVQTALVITINLDLDVTQAFLEDRRTDLWEELANVIEAHDFVFLKQPCGVGL